ncbi:AMP-binding protein [Saccharococcus caldoxylosilyticus]|jgi:fatty-acyl-CoA synthase|uniref:Long-chain-fatty-acid--CoA ligase n=2 Tax=Saccharococcus caldoxylosilyticus TaxID=81408 RepID=A0A023DFE9_9BACL|nr:AMP-binding protein [Parageobacillus caldoxylosilyticus]OQP02507.1 AMP-binding protein [Geobacillus sp. 44B]KYD15854.1 Long-chain-fatty-acid--CoA ligase [Parageobacillus caldoxylosilyticus]MBB3851508.1 fatty-acyl-CoA synthase [Parageobacillus caldoxylosilyticus]QNU37347.1 AMP-binding protein [Geobacillus sp. 44B]QXJ36855.1 Long-chain-fatty-acid--CoA ligase [Parageobacillus caldoxylosilyticus]
MLTVTVGKLLEEKARLHPDHEAVVYADRGLRMTYRQFNDYCRLVARGLMRLGIEKGENVSIWATNVPEWIACQFATGKMGAVLVTVNTNYRAAELEYLLKQSDSTTLFLIEQYRGSSYVDIVYEIVPELRTCEPGKLQSKRLPKLKNVVFIGEKRYPGMFTWNDILAMAHDVPEEQLDERMNSLDPHDVINMQYTSGTTGFPKGVMLTHYNIVNNAYNVAQCMKLTKSDRLCIPVPFFHCFGCVMSTLACATVGATMVPVQEFNPKQVLQTVQAERCTALHGVPTMFIAELNDPDFEKYDLSTLRKGIMAGSPCPIEVMKAVIEKMGIKEITIAYGQTESSPVITQTRTDDPIHLRVETVGRALPNVEVKIVEPGTNKEVPPGVQGELCTRGYHVMKGYYNNPDATKEVIDEDGWLHTGDLAVMDENGYCRITGRLKDMIIRGGENIYPREIEEFLYKHPKILDVQVVGVPDEKYGEEVMAWIILKEGQTATAEEIREFCRGKISRHKIPRYIEFIDSYPMTASGKIQKFKLREMAKQRLRLTN